MNYSHYSTGGYNQPPPNSGIYGQHVGGPPPMQGPPYGGPPMYDGPPPQHYDAPPAHTGDTWRGDNGPGNRSRSPDRYGGRHSRSNSPRRSRSPSYRRGRRSRSRSRSPYYRGSRHRSRSRSGSRYRSRSRERDHSWRRSRSPRRRSRSPYRRRSPGYEMQPSSKIMVTSLPQYADRDTLNILLARQGFHPVDIRVVRRNTDAGGMRVFGFIEFSDSAQAQQWMNYNDNYLRFEDGFTAKLEYSREDSASYAERRSAGFGAPPNPSSDWTCAKCTINNFNRRNACFKCGTSREDSEALESKGYGMVGVQPCDTLLIRELPVGVTEEGIRASLSRYTNVPILRLQISPSRRYTLIQLRSVEDASYLLSTFNKVVPYIDNCAVIVTFARLSLNQIVVAENVNALKSQVGLSSAHMHEDPTNSAAQLAHNAIQIAQMGRHMAAGGISESVQNISTPVGVFPIYPAPNRQGLQFEPSSGYYYDNSTGFYFDSKTEYYFNTQTNQWMFWCTKYSTYIPCEGGDQKMKKRLQEEDKTGGGSSSSAGSMSAAASSQVASGSEAVADVLRACVEQNKMLVAALAKAQSGRADPHMVRSLSGQVEELGRVISSMSSAQSASHKRPMEPPPFGPPMDIPPWKKPLMDALSGPSGYGRIPPFEPPMPFHSTVYPLQPPVNSAAFGGSPGRQLRVQPSGPHMPHSTFLTRNEAERPFIAKQTKKAGQPTPVAKAQKPIGTQKPAAKPTLPVAAPASSAQLPPQPKMCRLCGSKDHNQAACKDPHRPSAEVMTELEAAFAKRHEAWRAIKAKLEAPTMPLRDENGKPNGKNMKIFNRQLPRVVQPSNGFFRLIMEAFPDGVVYPRKFHNHCGKCAHFGHGKKTCTSTETRSADFLRKFHLFCIELQSFLKRFADKDGAVRMPRFYDEIRAYDALSGDNVLYRRLKEDSDWFKQGMVFQTKLARICPVCAHFGHKKMHCKSAQVDEVEVRRLRALCRALKAKYGQQLKKGMKISAFDQFAKKPPVSFELIYDPQKAGEKEADDGDQSDHSVILLDEDDETAPKVPEPEKYDSISELDNGKDDDSAVREVVEKMLDTLCFDRPAKEDVITLDDDDDKRSEAAKAEPAATDVGEKAPVTAATEAGNEQLFVIDSLPDEKLAPETNGNTDKDADAPSTDALVERKEVEELMPEDDEEDEQPTETAASEAANGVGILQPS